MKSLGEKSGRDNKESDKVGWVRTFIFLTYLTTNLFIISGVVRHWGDVKSCDVPLSVQK